MGDVGNPLSPTQIDFFRGVDVLLTLTGGPPTIELDDLDIVLRDVQPKIVIPMHYRIPNLNLKILGIEAFTSRYPVEAVEIRQVATIEVSRDTLPASLRVVGLQARANAKGAI